MDEDYELVHPVTEC